MSAILSLAIGDALGYPTEFLRAPDIRARYGPEGVTGFESSGRDLAGTYSDDTQMSLALARALLRAGRDDLETLMQPVSEEFVALGD